MSRYNGALVATSNDKNKWPKCGVCGKRERMLTYVDETAYCRQCLTEFEKNNKIEPCQPRK